MQYHSTSLDLQPPLYSTSLDLVLYTAPFVRATRAAVC